MDRRDAELLAGVQIEHPAVQFCRAPLKPLAEAPSADQSLLLGRSLYQAPEGGYGEPVSNYEPVEDGGFRIVGGKRRFNRLIVQGQNRIKTGDLPIFRMGTAGGVGVYTNFVKGDEKIFPLWARADAQQGGVWPSMGTLRIGIRSVTGQTDWLDEMPGVEITTTFRPGYTDYLIKSSDWKAMVRVAPALDSHGLICRISFDRAIPIVWRFGGMFWKINDTPSNGNQVNIDGAQVRITENNLPNGLLLAGWDGIGSGQAVKAALEQDAGFADPMYGENNLVLPTHGEEAEFVAREPQMVYHLVALWGVTGYDKHRSRICMARFDTPSSSAWPEERARLQQSWFDAYIGRALNPEANFARLLTSPAQELDRTCQWWDARRAEFQMHTPDRHLNALINWERCRSAYHEQGPGLVLSAGRWEICAHLSVGWYGREWSGDHAAIARLLRFHAALQERDGAIGWVAPSLGTFMNENNTPYWVDQVWRHFTWTGDRQFVHDLWPAVKRAAENQLLLHDPDDDGLFEDWYEYWNCDSNGKGPKSAASSATSWAMLDRSSRLAEVVGDGQAVRRYRDLADRSRIAIFRELWNEKMGRLGSIGADGQWQSHPQTWEEFLAANADLLTSEQSRSAMRWLAANYGFTPTPGVQLLTCSDWWPIVWSVQWIPVGDTCLAAMAGMRAGDADLWWPYLKTAVMSAFTSDTPGIRFGISNYAVGGGDIEDVDAVDPFLHASVRGLFGIEPAIHEGRIDICPGFPSDWTDASIMTPDLSYEYKRCGSQAVFTIWTAKPLIKRVRANISGPMVETPHETESVVTVELGPLPQAAEPAVRPPMLFQPATRNGGTQPPGTVAAPVAPPAPLVSVDEQMLFDLSAAYNTTQEKMIDTQFQADAGGWTNIGVWWHDRKLALPPMPRVVEETSGGVRFLTAGRPHTGSGTVPNSILALSSWPPYPLPAGITIPVGRHVEKFCFLLQCYVRSTKNYITNGEIVVHYAGGERFVESLVPPYNLDCYYQHFSLRGRPVLFGTLSRQPKLGGPEGTEMGHADVLEVVCDPMRVVESIEIRATCSEGIIGLLGMTAITTPRQTETMK